ncbi:MAG TPA: hypothetical protein VGE84_03165 [Allosphingosinicella sp.]
MKAPQTNSQAGGFIIAAAIIAGVVAGAIAGQPSIGVIAGAAIGILLATWIWLRDRAR